MVLALSGSAVGRTYLAQQHELIQDLLSLLHTASPRVQRQVSCQCVNYFLNIQVQFKLDSTVVVHGFRDASSFFMPLCCFINYMFNAGHSPFATSPSRSSASYAG